MVLNKFLKPLFSTLSRDKSQSRNPEVRKKAIQNIPVSNQAALNDIATNDSDENIRVIAVNKLHDLDMLQTIIMKGTNETVKEAAQNRLLQLLCGLKHPVPDFEIRKKMIRGSRNPTLLEFVAENADEASLRELTIKKISRDALLGNIALNDKNAQIRQLAAQQVAKRSTLERVAKNSRRKDKRVYKIIKTKLDRIIEDEERPAKLSQEVLDICVKLEKLHKRNLLLQEKTTFENYVTRWSEIQNFADPETKERYHTICANIISSMDELELVQQEQHEALLNLDRILSNLSTAVDDLLYIKENKKADRELIDNSQKIISNLSQDWKDIIDIVQAKDIAEAYNSRFQTIIELADSKTEIVQDNTNIEKIKHLTEQAENMLNKSGFIPENTISVLQTKFKQQLENSATETDEITSFKNRFDKAINILSEQLIIQKIKAQDLRNKLNRSAEKINVLITDGNISNAEKLMHADIKLIDKSSLISNIEKQHFLEQFKKIQLQLGDLSSWRNWAHHNERENLVLKAQQLAEQAVASQNLAKDYQDITFSVKELRQQWKKMRTHAKEELWHDFNNACNLAYEQCTPFIDKESLKRQENLKKKQLLCQQLEDYIEKMNWPTPETAEIDHSINWIQVHKITKQARKEWSEIGFVDRKEHKAINKRFDHAIETIRSELKKVWHINHEKFFNLIKQVEALHPTLEDDLAGAINKTRDYQNKWKEIGPVSPYQRNKLWKKFRKACDLVFDKRQQNIEQKNNFNTEKLREKEAICENLEALNEQPLNLKDLKNAYKDIKNLWHELEPQAKSLSQQVNKRYALAVNNYTQKLETLIAEQQQLKLELIKQKAALCTEIEALQDVDDETIAQFKKQWSSLEENPLNGSELKHRFNNAIKALNSDTSSLKEKEREAKLNFCLKYEILLAKESPVEYRQARMEKQVELLNSNLGANGNNDFTGDDKSIYELQLQWYEHSNFIQDEALEQRFANLISD